MLNVERGKVDNIINSYGIKNQRKDLRSGVKMYDEKATKMIMDLDSSRVFRKETKDGLKQDEDIKMLGRNDVATMLGISARTANRIIAQKGDFPRFILIGKTLKWTRLSVRNWITEKQR